MRILLVSAATPDTFWSYKHVLPLVSKKAVFPPLGLLTVAAMLPREWELELVDLNVDRLSDEQIRRADYVMVSAMIVQADSARRVIERCRRLDRPVIAGGPLFTTGHDTFVPAAHFVAGEAEEIMPALVEDMRAGTLRPLYRAEGRPDVRRTPAPRWDLVDLRSYALMPVQFSRGCPFDCEFCDVIVMNGRVPRVKDVGQMIGELDGLLEAGWRGPIFIVDDNFIGNRAKVRELLVALIEWRRRRRVAVQFTTEASLNLADEPELLALMAEAGFKKVFVGLETPQLESLVECAKVQNVRRDMLEAVRTIQRAGLEVMGGFIVGFDSDEPGIFERQIRFVQEAGVVTAMVGLLTALPGTRLFSRLQREGRILRETTGNNMDGVLNFVPRLDRQMLLEGYRSLVQQLYAPRTYYRRILTFLREYRPRGPRFQISRSDVLALIKSFWVIGLRGPGRREYWKFLARILLFHRRAFAEAMSLAIYGYHYRRIAATL